MSSTLPRISPDFTLQEVAKEVLEVNESQLEIALSKGELMEVCYVNEDAE